MLKNDKRILILFQRLLFIMVIFIEVVKASNLTIQDFENKFSIYNLHNIELLNYFDKPCETFSVLQLPNAKITGSEYVKLPTCGTIVSSYMGVKERADNKDLNGTYQCVEFVKRFYKNIFNIKYYHTGGGKGTAKAYGGKKGTYMGKPIRTFYFPIKNKYCNSDKRNNDKSICYYDNFSNNIFEQHPPFPGTILSFAPTKSNKWGHTAIVKYFKQISGNEYEIYIIEQNYITPKGISVNRKFTFEKINGSWTIIGDSTPIIGWTTPFYINKTKCITRENLAKLFLVIFKDKLKFDNSNDINRLNKIKDELRKKIEINNITKEYFVKKYPKYKWVWNWVIKDQWTTAGVVLKFNGIWKGQNDDMMKNNIVTDRVLSIMLKNFKMHNIILKSNIINNKNLVLTNLFVGKTYYQITDNSDYTKKIISTLQFKKDGKTLIILTPDDNILTKETFIYSITNGKLHIKGPIHEDIAGLYVNITLSSFVSKNTYIESSEGAIFYKTKQAVQNIIDTEYKAEMPKKIEEKISNFVNSNYDAQVTKVQWNDIYKKINFTIKVQDYSNMTYTDVLAFWYKYFMSSNAFYKMIGDAIRNANNKYDLKMPKKNNKTWTFNGKIPVIFNNQPYYMDISPNLSDSYNKSRIISIDVLLTPKNSSNKARPNYFYEVGRFLDSIFNLKPAFQTNNGTTLGIRG